MSLADKFRRLRQLRLRPDGEPYDISEIAREASRLYREQQIFRATEQGANPQEIEALHAERDVVNRQYLHGLKEGERPNPPFNIIEALSLFFEVSPAYWSIGPHVSEETRRAEGEVELIEQTVAVARLLNGATESGQAATQGTRLVGALMRGAAEGDPGQVAGILRLAVQALQATPADRVE
jgi:hypothetical protein